MGNKFKDTKNHTYDLLDDMINMKNIDLNKIKIDESHTKIFLFIALDM